LKIKYFSIFKLLNPWSYSIMVFVLIFSNILILNSKGVCSSPIERPLQKSHAIEILQNPK